MTTFQDPPPQSRRAVRQSERGESPQQPTPAATAAGAAESATPYEFDSTVANDSTATPPAAAPSTPPGEQAAAPPHSGRRAQQGRAPAPPDAQTSQPLASSPPPAPPGETPEQAAYRLRDFSPGARRTSDASPTAGFAAPAAPITFDQLYQTQNGAHSGGAGASLSLDDTLNHTLSRRELREMRAAAEAEAPELQQPSGQLPEPIDALLSSGPIDIPTLAPPPGQSQALAEAMAEFDLLTRSRREAEARARDAQVASLATPIVPQAASGHRAASHSAPPVEPAQASAPQAPAAEQLVPEQLVPEQLVPEQLVPERPAPIASAPQAPAPVAATQPSAPQPPVPQLPFQQESVPQPPQPSVDQAQFSVPSAPQAIVAQPIAYPPTAALPSSPPEPWASAPAPPQVGSLEQPPVLAAPTFASQPASPTTAPVDDQDPHRGRSPRASGHWRVQAAIEDDELPYENTLSRTVGSNTSAITTSALVLPSVPQPDLILNSLTSTGEIIVTGTIDLPRSLGSTGAHPSRVDNSDYEDDPLDSQVAAPDSAPIRAIRAISTNTSTRGVIETKRPQGNRMLTAVIAVASVLCVGLVGLLVFAFATGKL
jgi:hypothetical protein